MMCLLWRIGDVCLLWRIGDVCLLWRMGDVCLLVCFPLLASGSATGAAKSSDSDSTAQSKPKLPSFWVPSVSTVAKPTELKKPVSCKGHVQIM